MKTPSRKTGATGGAIILALLFPATMQAQELEVRWANYLSCDAELEVVVTREQQWLIQQQELNEEIRQLDENQPWYNGWIVELMLARKSTRLVALADSLRQVRTKIADLRIQREDAFQELRQVYEQILLDPESQGQLSLAQKEQALTIGSRLIAPGKSTVQLPDYSSIINGSYENESLKYLVWTDLRSVLLSKLLLIDSLLVEKETELALLTRLNEFHRDLGYQLQSDLDPGPGSSQETDDFEFFGEKENDPITAGGVLDWGSGSERSGTTGSDRNLATSLEQARGVPNETNVQLDAASTYAAIGQLISKRQQYQDLIRQIETELPH